jgi:hypothetical protein
MDKAEAGAVARERVAELRRLSWAELRDRYLSKSETIEVAGASGATYQVKAHAVWDGDDEGDLRVFVEVDDGGWRAFVPLAEDFIISPDGSFVGE